MYKVFQELLHDFRLSSLLPALSIGLFMGVLVVILEISFAAMVFSGEMSPLAARGAGLTLAGALIAGIVTSLTSSVKSIINLPQDVPVAIFAGAAALIASKLGNESQNLFITIVAGFILSTLFTAALMFIVTRFRLTNFFRFLPYPVIGGFLAGTGWLLFTGGLEVILGISLTLSNLDSFFSVASMQFWVPGVFLAVLIFSLLRAFSHFAILPLTLVSGVVIFHLILYFSGISPEEARQSGLLFQTLDVSGSLWPVFSFADLHRVEWLTLLSQLPILLIIPFITLIGLLLNVSGMELAFKQEVNMNREINSHGLANFLSAFVGSSASHSSLALSMLGFKAGAYSRLVGLFSSLVVALTLIWGVTIVSVFPKFILGIFLILLGLMLLWDWVIETRKKMIRTDYIIILTILICVVWLGFFQGVVLGILLAVIFFVVRISQVPIFRNLTTGTWLQSTKIRPMPHYRLLQENSERIQIVQLSGYLFFGSVSALNDQMYERITQNTSSDVTFVLLDFSSTTGIDISAISAFARLLNKGEGYNLCFILIDMHPNFIQQLNNLTGIEDEKNYYIILNDLDQGLRYAEDQIIEENINQMKSETNRLNQSKLFDQVADDMLQELEDLEYIEKILKDLEPYSVAYELKKGEILLQPAQEIHGFFWIQYGKLVEKDNQSPGSGSIKEYISGDVLNIEGLFRKTEIQSTLKAETGCSLQYFSRLNIAELEKSDPQRCSQLYALLLRKMVS